MDILLHVWPSTSPLIEHVRRNEKGVEIVPGDQLIASLDSAPSSQKYEMLILHIFNELTPLVSVALSYALFRKQIPVLLLYPLSMQKPDLGLDNNEAALTFLTVWTYSDAFTLHSACHEFLSFPDVPGRIFTIEGGDGSGKQTQSKLLVDRLHAEGYDVETLDFPHDTAMYGDIIREALSGKFGRMSDLNPLLFATLYSFNRHDTSPRLLYWIKRGKNVILDRYSSANWGHQASKADNDEERLQIIDWLRIFEHKWLRLPESYRTIYLDLSPSFAFKAMQEDGSRTALDMHETAGIQYKNRVRCTFLWCCDHFSSWQCVPCTSLATGEERRLSREAVHNEIFSQLSPHFVNKKR